MWNFSWPQYLPKMLECVCNENNLHHYQPWMHPLNCQQHMSIDIIVTILLVVCFSFSSWHRSRLTLLVKTVKGVVFCPFLCHFWLICRPHSTALAQKLKAFPYLQIISSAEHFSLWAAQQLHYDSTNTLQILQTLCAPMCCFLKSPKRIRTHRAKDFPNCYLAVKS